VLHIDGENTRSSKDTAVSNIQNWCG